MIRAFTTTVKVHGRRCASQRLAGVRRAMSSPTWATVSTRMHTVGGLMFDRDSPGTPTMLVGYGPQAVSTTSTPKAAAAATRSDRLDRPVSHPSP
ncbi:MAG: hypothetical protein R2726_20275 [Acidimicrobiales bacterium]